MTLRQACFLQEGVIMSRKDHKGKVLQKGEYQRPDGRYLYAYTNESHKRIYVYADTLDELRKKERNIMMSTWSGIEHLGEKVTVNILYDKAMSLKFGLKDSTIASYRQTYDNHVRNDLGKRDIQGIKYSDIMTFYNHLLNDKKLGIKTVQHVHTQLLVAFKLALRDGLIVRNPVEECYESIKKQSGKQERKIRALTLREQKTFLEYMYGHPVWGRYHSIFQTMVGTGLRIGELAGLRWQDIDLENRLINVNHTLVFVKKVKGEEKEHISVSTPKTAAGIRNVPIMLPVVESIKEEYLIARAKKFRSQKIGGYTDFVFTQQTGTVYTSMRLDGALCKIVRSYNTEETLIAEYEHRKPFLLPHISNHMLRHTFCTRLCERDVNIKVIQTIMGHASIKITMDIYAEVSEEKKLAEIDNMACDLDVF